MLYSTIQSWTESFLMLQFKCMFWDVPASPVVKILHFRGHGFDSQFGNWDSTWLLGGRGGKHLLTEYCVSKKVSCPFSVQFSCSVLSDSLQPYGLQHARSPCLSPRPGACSNSCPSSQWCHPTVSSSVVPFSSCPRSFKASGSFPMSKFFDQVAKVLEFQLQHQSFQWTPGTDLL